MSHQPLLRYRLGLDLGSASIGWAVVAEDDQGEPCRIQDLGVRRFEAGVEGDIEGGRDESRGTARRDARGQRRQLWRRQYRVRAVFRVLQEMGLLPESESAEGEVREQVLLDLDNTIKERAKQRRSENLANYHAKLPYILRAKAIDEELELDELGRALFHLAHRRGFLSNRKASSKDDDDGVVKSGISELVGLMEDAGSRTLGEYFASLDPEEYRIRERWTARKMYLDEFEAIWTAQAKHHPGLLTDESKERLHRAIFFQRKLKSQKGLIGMCDLEQGHRRAPAACLEFQQFRSLQKVNDLEVIQPDGECRALTEDERAKLLEYLGENGKITFGHMRTKLFKFKKSKEYGRNYSFNFEEGGEKELPGNRTAAKMSECLDGGWHDLEPSDQKRLVDDILSFEMEEPLINRLTGGWNLDTATAAKIADTHFEQGHGSLSRKAIRRLLPKMADGVRFATARKEIYGEREVNDDPLDSLPALHNCALLRTMRNPAVARALSELRKVINAVTKKYGKPERIHVELARDLKHSRKRRKDMSNNNRQNQKVREAASKKILAELGNERYCSRNNILKVLLAEECDWTCPFTGKRIEMRALVGDQPQFDIEHIIPFSRSLDNSYLNKTLCHHNENRHVKGNRTPFEAYSGTDKWDDIIGRVKRFKADHRTRGAKLQRFLREELLDSDEFANRQLNDTSYMSTLATEYLGLLFGGQIDEGGRRRIHSIPGRGTAYLRQRWNLNSLLGHPDKKERADHRHHAVDALVVALAGPREVKMLSQAAAEAEEKGLPGLFVDVDLPWDSFLEEARTHVDEIIISSRVTRKLNGRLHKDTIFSHPKPGVDAKGKPVERHHVRKKLQNLSKSEVAKIVDPNIRALVEQKLREVHADPQKAFADKVNHPHMRSKKGKIIPIHKVRIEKSDHPMSVGRGKKARFVVSDTNHHIEVVAVLDDAGNEKKWEYHLVSRFEAVQRKKAGLPIIVRDHGDGKAFKFSLSGGESVEMAFAGDERKLYRVFAISGAEVEFMLHTDARPFNVRKETRSRIRAGAEKLRKCGARKVVIDPIGNVFPAHD